VSSARLSSAGSAAECKTRHQKWPSETGGQNDASLAEFRTRRPRHICETSRCRAVFEGPSCVTRWRRVRSGHMGYGLFRGHGEGNAVIGADGLGQAELPEDGLEYRGGRRALQQYTSAQKKSPTICGGADFLPKLGLIFLVGRSRSRGTGVGASIFGTARNKALTLRPVPIAV
jgi:hypothetical protein